MKKKSLFTTGIAMGLVMAMSMTSLAAVAADGAGAAAPYGDTAEGASTGSATITSDTGVTFNTENDDDTVSKASDIDGADINVWAKVVDSSSKIYKVDLAWGAMKFEYKSGSGLWNTTTHEYESTGGTGAWTTGYLDGENNKVTVTNHSNNAIDATFEYTMQSEAFNLNESGNNIVIGHFFEDNNDALTAALKLTESNTVINAVNKVTLDTADEYNDGSVHTSGARDESIFFAFSGTPDEGKGQTLNNFQKVGIITVTVAPNAERAAQYE